MKNVQSGSGSEEFTKKKRVSKFFIIGATVASFIHFGVGTSAAREAIAQSVDSSASIDAASNGAEFTYDWTLSNNTPEAIYGYWSVEEGSHHSAVEFSKDNPMRSAESTTQSQDFMMFYNSYWSGHICYDKKWRNFQRKYYASQAFDLAIRPSDNKLVAYFTNWGDQKMEVPLVDTADPC